ncbi:ALP1-like protein [Tanacetum coccineum]
MKCTFVIRQLAYGSVPDSLDEYLQMGATTTHKSLQIFCKVIMNLYGEEFLRKPTYTDMEKLYARHDEKHGFPGMLGSIDCTHWPWANCPVAYRAQFSRGDHGPDPFILLEAIASNDLWIWHAFFGVSGMNNDVNVLRQSPIFNDLKSGRAPDVPFVANNVPYKRGYYLTDGIYPQWSVLIKSIKNPGRNDHKRILYKTKHEAARKDVERAFGVLKLKWKLIKYPARGMTQSRLSDVMYTCIILHNMIIHDNGNAISPGFFPEEQHRDDDPIRTHAESMQVTQEIVDRTAHLRGLLWRLWLWRVTLSLLKAAKVIVRVLEQVEERFRADKAGDTIYRGFRSRRQIADCTALIEQSWWKLLDSAEPNRSFISFFDLDPNERRAFCVGA